MYFCFKDINKYINVFHIRESFRYKVCNMSKIPTIVKNKRDEEVMLSRIVPRDKEFPWPNLSQAPLSPLFARPQPWPLFLLGLHSPTNVSKNPALSQFRGRYFPTLGITSPWPAFRKNPVKLAWQESHHRWCLLLAIFVLFFWLCPQNAEVPRPGITPAPQQWRGWILKPLGQQGTPSLSYSPSTDSPHSAHWIETPSCLCCPEIHLPPTWLCP